MSQVLARKAVTDAAVAALITTGFPIGDAAPPELPDTGQHAGWNGQPDADGSFFVPYAVLVPATITQTSGPLSDPQADVRVPYQLSIFGINRGQVEDLADRCRQSLLPLRKQVLDLAGVNHKVQQVEFTSVGGIGRVDAANPPTFGEVDTITIWLTK